MNHTHFEKILSPSLAAFLGSFLTNCWPHGRGHRAYMDAHLIYWHGEFVGKSAQK